MAKEPKLKIDSEVEQAIRDVARLEAKYAKLEQKVATTGKVSRRAGRRSASGWQKAQTFAATYAASLVGVGGVTAAIRVVRGEFARWQEDVQKAAEAARARTGDPYRQLLGILPQAEREDLRTRLADISDVHGIGQEVLARSQLALERRVAPGPGKREFINRALEEIATLGETVASGREEEVAGLFARMKTAYPTLSARQISNLSVQMLGTAGVGGALKGMEFAEGAGLGPAEAAGMLGFLGTEVAPRRIPSVLKAMLDVTQLGPGDQAKWQVAQRLGITEEMGLEQRLGQLQGAGPADITRLAPELVDYSRLLAGIGGPGYQAQVAGARGALETERGLAGEAYTLAMAADPTAYLVKKSEELTQQLTTLQTMDVTALEEQVDELESKIFSQQEKLGGEYRSLAEMGRVGRGVGRWAGRTISGRGREPLRGRDDPEYEAVREQARRILAESNAAEQLEEASRELRKSVQRPTKGPGEEGIGNDRVGNQ